MLPWALQMLAFLQHPYMLLAAKASLFWTSLLSSSERAAGRAEPLTPETTPIPLDCVAALMDLAGKHTPPILHCLPTTQAAPVTIPSPMLTMPTTLSGALLKRAHHGMQAGKVSASTSELSHRNSMSGCSMCAWSSKHPYWLPSWL